MTAPRPVFPGCFLFVTRRCTQGQFLLRPDDETNNAFMYCLADAAERCEMVVVLSQMMSNHHHMLLYDPMGKQVEFREHFHKLMAKSQNALRRRSENLWSSAEPSVVELGVEDLLEKLVYIATNPVKDGLVERVKHWPGPKFVRALLTGEPMTAQRPRHFFRERGTMPLEVTLVMKLPDHFDGKAEFLDQLRRRIGVVEDELARERRATGRKVLGRHRVLQQSWHDSATTELPQRELRPRLAARDTKARIAIIERNKAWQAAYWTARKAWRDGNDVEFPYGTYWLKRFAGVRVAPSLENG
jgi:putative transposase